MTDRSDGQWSGNYWGLHRNSLLLSSALLLVSLPHAKMSIGKLVGLELGGASLSIALWAAVCAATYAFVTFTFEWRNEALPTWRLRSDRMTTIIDQIERAAEVLRGAMATSADATMSILAKLETYRTNAQIPMGRSPEDIRVRVGGAFVAQGNVGDFLRELIAKVSQPEFSKSIDPMAYRGAETLWSLQNAVANQLCEMISKFLIDNGLTKGFEDDLALGKLIEQLTTAYTAAAASFADTELSIRRARRRISEGLFYEALRAGGIGLALPAILYLTALAHFLGRLGLQVAPSLVVWLVNLGPVSN